jgi:hypothetical protein
VGRTPPPVDDLAALGFEVVVLERAERRHDDLPAATSVGVLLLQQLARGHGRRAAVPRFERAETVVVGAPGDLLAGKELLLLLYNDDGEAAGAVALARVLDQALALAERRGGVFRPLSVANIFAFPHEPL